MARFSGSFSLRCGKSGKQEKHRQEAAGLPDCPPAKMGTFFINIRSFSQECAAYRQIADTVDLSLASPG